MSPLYGNDNVLLSELLEIDTISDQLIHFGTALKKKYSLRKMALSLFDESGNKIDTLLLSEDTFSVRAISCPWSDDSSEPWAALKTGKYWLAKNADQAGSVLNLLIDLFQLSSECVAFPLTRGGEMLALFWVEAESVSAITEGIGDAMAADLTVFKAALAQAKLLQTLSSRSQEKNALALCSEFSKIQNKKDLYRVIDVTLKSIFRFKGFAIGLISTDGLYHNAFIFNCDDYDSAALTFDTTASLKYDVNDGLFNKLIETQQPQRIIIDQLDELPPYVQLWKSFQAQSFIAIPLRVATRSLGVLYLTFEDAELAIPHNNLLVSICDQLAMSVSNIVAMEKIKEQLEEIRLYKEQLEEERVYLQSEASSRYEFNEIIGDSPVMKKIFQLITQVAATESTALILGETGTGKELIARAIHNRSPRKDNLMVKLNCSAIPVNLIESELFGHEKGSFTGAIERRIGKFELANNGTLFLDEIGEMPLDMQAKLLRALQEREIERVGGKTTIKVNVRIIAATNRNLTHEVATGKFRSDLYYRLNVFPITLPPLRERLDDIPALTTYFLDKLSKKTGKSVEGISERAMETLIKYTWPGNVRELEHLIERSILVTKGNIIREIPLAFDFASERSLMETEKFKTLEQAEKEYIIQVLNRCNGKVYGPGGAAEILGLKRSTLVSKMSKLGIIKEKAVYK